MYSIGFRIAALYLYDYFKSLRKTAAVLKVSIASLSRWNACIEIKKWDRKCTKTTDALRNFVSIEVNANPCISCPLLCLKIKECFDINISRQLVHLIIKDLNFSFKRIRTRGCSKKKEQKTALFLNAFKSMVTPQTTIISIDESGFDHRAHQIYGYSKKGQPAIATSTYTTDRKRYNLLLAVASDGTKCFRLYDENIDSNIFNSFLKSKSRKII